MSDLSPRWKKEWPAFVAALQERLERGYHAYGDDSFDCLTTDLMEQLAEEALDLAGWGLVLWARIQSLIERTGRAQAQRGAVQ